MATSKRKRNKAKGNRPNRDDSSSDKFNASESSANMTIRTSAPLRTPTYPSQSNFYKASVTKLPTHARTLKGLLQYLSRISDTIIHDNITLRFGVVRVKSTDPDIAKKLPQLRKIIDINIIVTDTPDRRTQQPIRKEPSLSCVITGVDKDVTIAEVEEHLQKLSYKSVWRIKSSLTTRRPSANCVTSRKIAATAWANTRKPATSECLNRPQLKFRHRHQPTMSCGSSRQRQLTRCQIRNPAYNLSLLPSPRPSSTRWSYPTPARRCT